MYLTNYYTNRWYTSIICANYSLIVGIERCEIQLIFNIISVNLYTSQVDLIVACVYAIRQIVERYLSIVNMKIYFSNYRIAISVLPRMICNGIVRKKTSFRTFHLISILSIEFIYCKQSIDFQTLIIISSTCSNC